ncbi:MAG: hypothetical protein JRF56_16790 [Deltaproteobacteria bacterium]|jgi:hypothetical protein|nr:hypothetical protein [Deltaproteobacteria bacterium]
MKKTIKKLLIIDGIVNLLLGVLLLLFPFGIAPILGVPVPDTHFYPTILGAVLFGIGIALLIDGYGQPHGIRGLGMAGAIAINFCGAGILTLWLIFDPLSLPLRGYIVLWAIAIVVLAIGFVELTSKSWKQ